MSPFEAPFTPDRAPPGRVFADAVWAAALLAIDPGLGGITIRAWSGPARDEFLAGIKKMFPAGTVARNLPLHTGDDRLLGGIDLAATLQSGRTVVTRGLLDEVSGGVLVLSMAERVHAGTAARIAAALDGGGFAVIALDEGDGPDEAPPAKLLERLAFTVAALPGGAADWPSPHDIVAARRSLPGIDAGAEALPQLTALAAAFGIGSLRPAIFALRAARAASSLRGLDAIGAEDIALAARLVLAPRATRMPATPDEAPAAEEEQDAPADQKPQDAEALEDRVAASEAAVLPPELLAALASHAGPRRMTRGAGKNGDTASQKRGRPAGTRRGNLTAGARLSVLDTLRAAAPWQRLRPHPTGRIAIRADDFRVKKFKEQARSIAIFAVDASGSSAVNRLAEAKGAIQLLLAECYVRRDQVALIAFRNRAAECLLPPTGALARAKRALAGLPGGGPTPLASGIAAARELASAQARRGNRPLLVLLTDGGANIGRDGKPGRAAAAADAAAAARLCRSENLAALVVDTAPRPNAFVATIAREMGAKYLALPYADSAGLRAAVRAAGGAHG